MKLDDSNVLAEDDELIAQTSFQFTDSRGGRRSVTKGQTVSAGDPEVQKRLGLFKPKSKPLLLAADVPVVKTRAKRTTTRSTKRSRS